MRKTKILATYGPAIENRLEDFLKKVDGIRINTAFGDVEEHKRRIKKVRSANPDTTIVLDIKGPELRVILDEPLHLRRGEIFHLNFKGNNGFTHDIEDMVKKGDKFFFDDGKIEAEVVYVDDGIDLRSLSDGILENKKSAYIEGKELEGPSLTEKDIKELIMANEEEVEYVALSFTRSKEDVLAVKKIYKGGVIAKIENEYGYKNIDEIIDVAEGIMVARGDLALHIGLENVPLAQKEMIRKCNEKGKLVITATQVLKSMVSNPYPTRAEISDIANAILDGTDVIMLSDETTIGKYPVKVVNVLNKVALTIEKEVKSNIKDENYKNVSDAISKSIHAISQVLPLTYIASITRSGYTARMISRFRLKQRIFALTNSETVKRQLNLFYGVIPLYFEIPDKKIIKTAGKFLYDREHINKKDFILFTAGIRTKQKHASNLIEIHKINELLK